MGCHRCGVPATLHFSLQFDFVLQTLGLDCVSHAPLRVGPVGFGSSVGWVGRSGRGSDSRFTALTVDWVSYSDVRSVLGPRRTGAGLSSPLLEAGCTFEPNLSGRGVEPVVAVGASIRRSSRFWARGTRRWSGNPGFPGTKILVCQLVLQVSTESVLFEPELINCM